jgi:hypothetical protein
MRESPLTPERTRENPLRDAGEAEVAALEKSM